MGNEAFSGLKCVSWPRMRPVADSSVGDRERFVGRAVTDDARLPRKEGFDGSIEDAAFRR